MFLATCSPLTGDAQLDSLGADGELRGLGQNISIFAASASFSFSSTQRTTLFSTQTLVRTTKIKVTLRIKQIQILLNAYTNREIPLESVNLGNLTFSVPTTAKPGISGEYFLFCTHWMDFFWFSLVWSNTVLSLSQLNCAQRNCTIPRNNLECCWNKIGCMSLIPQIFSQQLLGLFPKCFPVSTGSIPTKLKSSCIKRETLMIVWISYYLYSTVFCSCPLTHQRLKLFLLPIVMNL